MTAIPTFSPTSSPELDQALGRFRQEIFIPSTLSKRQRLSMLKEKDAKRLEQEQITVDVGESEQYTLRPRKLTDLPTKNEAGEVLRMMAAAKEYTNLIPFMRGLWMSNYRVSPGRWEYLMRHTRPAGKLYLILECAKQAERTGLRFRDVLLMQRFFFELHLMAQESKFQGPEFTKAFNLAKQALDIMDAHLSGDGSKPREQDPRTQPGVIATLLELSAARAVNDFDRNDDTKEVLGYAQKLVACSPGGHFQATAPTPKTSRQLAEKWVQEAATVLSALRTSLSVRSLKEDKGTQKAVRSRLDEVEQALRKVLKDPSLESRETSSWALARKMLKL